MQHPNNSVAARGSVEPAEATEPTDAPASAQPGEPARLPWQAEVGLLLSHAASLCIEHGIEVDTYMSGAWAAYVEARPGMRDHLEEAQLRQQLDELRKLGRLASA